MATCNLDWFNSLSLENQKLVQEAVQAGVEFQRELDKNSTDDYKNTLKEAGLEIIELSEEEIGAFKAMMEPANAVVAEKADVYKRQVIARPSTGAAEILNLNME